MMLFFPFYSSFFLPPRNNNRFFFYLTLLLCFFPLRRPLFPNPFFCSTHFFYPSSSPRQEGERGAKPAQVRAAAAALPFLPTVVH